MINLALLQKNPYLCIITIQKLKLRSYFYIITNLIFISYEKN